MDIYEMITNKFIEALEGGEIPWQRPWVRMGGAYSHITGRRYSLLNQFLLGKAGEYLTFNQVMAEGGKVKKGEKAKFVVFYKMIEKEVMKDGCVVRDDDGKIVKKQIPLLKYINVFHIDQCEGIKQKYNKPITTEFAPIDVAEEALEGYVNRSGVRLEHRDGDVA